MMPPKVLLLVLSAWTVGSSLAAATSEPVTIPKRGAASRQPARFWEGGFLTGNGRIGAILFGNPGDETVVLSQCRLFLPLGDDSMVPDIGQSLPELRQIIKTQGYNRGMAFVEQQAKAAGWGGILQNTDPFHPAFFLKIDAPAEQAGDYLRTEDFQTGEVAVRWTAAGKEYRRRLFVSRPDNVAVLSLTGEKFSCDLAVPPIDPAAQVRAYQLDHPAEPKENSAANVLIQEERKTDIDGITLHNKYKFGKGGYDAAIRVVIMGGSATSDGQKISVKDADEVLLLMRAAGRMQLGLCAARLGRGEDVWEILTKMATTGAIYPSMGSSHYENGKVFNMDANGAMPQIIDNALVFSRPGHLDLLPALPAAMPRGEIKGLRARGQITVKDLKWEPSAVEAELVSLKEQPCKSMPRRQLRRTSGA